jgi:hypothetical protein
MAPSSALSAPLAGSFQTDFVIHPVHCGVDEDEDTFVDEDPGDGVDNDQDGLTDEDTCLKVDDTIIKFEADLVLHLNVSGFQLSSTTVFTFKGVEFQSFAFSTTIGALSVKDVFIFAPSVTEIEQVHTNSTLKIRYCIRSSAPGTVIPPFMPCPMPDNLLYLLLEDSQLSPPAVSNLRLAQIFDEAGMLDPELVFRKKIVDFSLSIAGLTFGAHTMFVDLGAAGTPDYHAGTILFVEGYTVGGTLVRAELWWGARPGLECFAECKPLERFYGGIVIPGFSPQHERIIIRNLTLAGVTFGLVTEFNFFAEPDTYCPLQGICYVEITMRGRLAPLGLQLENTLRLDGTLTPRFDFARTTMKFGDVSATMVWYFYLYETNTWESQLLEITTVYDPPGVTVISDILLCTESYPLCIPPSAVFEHDITISSTVSTIRWEARFIFLNLISDFYQLTVDTSWKTGSITLSSSATFARRALDGLAFSIRVEF